MIITNHFRDNWRARVGGRVPSPAEIAEMLMEAVLVQPARSLYRRNKRNFERFNLLASYWHPGRGVVLKIDESNGERVAVSVLSRANMKRVAWSHANSPESSYNQKLA